MNIFVLDKDANNCAKYLCNVHLNKMLIEHSQMLANCYSKESLLINTNAGNQVFSTSCGDGDHVHGDLTVHVRR